MARRKFAGLQESLTVMPITLYSLAFPPTPTPAQELL